MTNQDLADYLNTTVGLRGTKAVTANVVRQWVGWDVLPRSTPAGQTIGKAPAWSRSEEGSNRAVRLAELRRDGIHRKNAVIAQAYFEWGHPDFDLVRHAILNEFIKWRGQLNRRQTTFLGPQKIEGASASRMRAIKNQLGPLDQRFVGTPFEQSEKLYAMFGDASRTGDADTSQMASLLNNALIQIAHDFEGHIPETAISAIASAIPGLTGTPDEIDNSGETTIKNATEQQFETARRFANGIIKAPTSREAQILLAQLDASFRELAKLPLGLHPQISIGSWLIFLFVHALQMIVNVPDWERNFPDISVIS